MKKDLTSIAKYGIIINKYDFSLLFRLTQSPSQGFPIRDGWGCRLALWRLVQSVVAKSVDKVFHM